MSRSFRKIYRPICSSNGDKWCRTQYQRSFRRKSNSILKEISLLHIDDYLSDDTSALDCMNSPLDKIIVNGKDRSLYYSDKWSWSSDGGTHWRADKHTYYKKFNKVVFGQYENVAYGDCDDIWEDYVAYNNCKLNHASKRWIIYYDKPDKEVFEYHDYWVPEREEWVTYKEKHMNYTRCSIVVNHKPRKTDIPKDAVFINFYRHYSLHNKPFNVYRRDSDLIEFLFYRNLIPTDFKSKSELVSWLLKNENYIVNTWHKIYSRK